MKIKEIIKKLITKDKSNGLSLFHILGMFMFFVAAVEFITSTIRVIFCAILSVRCIDQETGKQASIDWRVIFSIILLGTIFYFIGTLRNRYRNNR